MLFDFMKWNPDAKYHIPAIYQEFGDKKVMTFNLDEADHVFLKVSSAEGGKRRRSTIVQFGHINASS
jgi:hypothetical protein